MSSSRSTNSTGSVNSRPGLHTYKAPFYIFAENWSIRNDKNFRLAISSVYEDQERVQIVHIDPSGEIRPDPNLSFYHPHSSANSLAFIPDKKCQHADLLASADEMLRLWQISDGRSGRRVDLKCQLSNNGGDEAATLTSFDWNAAAPRRIVTSCINNTCTVWDVERETVEAYLAEHGDVVNDVAWGGGADVFASASFDGTVRVWDVRVGGGSSQIVYTTTGLVGRVGWSNMDRNCMALTIMGSNKVVVLDTRRQWLPVAELRQHEAAVNAFAWAPYSSRHICTAGDDSRALIWELPAEGRMPEGGFNPVFDYTAAAKIERVKWSCLQQEWVAITFENTLQIVRV